MSLYQCRWCDGPISVGDQEKAVEFNDGWYHVDCWRKYCEHIEENSRKKL